MTTCFNIHFIIHQESLSFSSGYWKTNILNTPNRNTIRSSATFCLKVNSFRIYLYIYVPCSINSEHPVDKKVVFEWASHDAIVNIDWTPLIMVDNSIRHVDRRQPLYSRKSNISYTKYLLGHTPCSHSPV